jgi:hypothetical protein
MWRAKNVHQTDVLNLLKHPTMDINLPGLYAAKI